MRIEIDLKDCNNALYKQNELKLNALQFNCRVTVVFVETLQGHNSLLNCFLVPVKLGKGDDYSLYRDLSISLSLLRFPDFIFGYGLSN